jgi:hypothetical protein
MLDADAAGRHGDGTGIAIDRWRGEENKPSAPHGG